MGVHRLLSRPVSHLNLRQEDVDYITERTKKELKKQVALRKKQAVVKTEELKKIEKQIERLEERMIIDELEPATYKKYFRKFKSQQACLTEEIAYFNKSSEDDYNQQLLLLPYPAENSRFSNTNHIPSGIREVCVQKNPKNIFEWEISLPRRFPRSYSEQFFCEERVRFSHHFYDARL